MPFAYSGAWWQITSIAHCYVSLNRGCADKEFKVIKGATHYYQGQPELLQEAVDTVIDWMRKHNFAE